MKPATKPIIDVWSGGRAGLEYVATDRFGRLRLSSALLAKLSAKGTLTKLYIGYDAANHRIALGKPDVVKPTDSQPVNFDKSRGVTTAMAFYKKHQIPLAAAKYVYDGTYEGWYMFKAESFAATDKRGS